MIISPNTVSVWLLRLPSTPPDAAQALSWRSWLSAEECAKADAFVADRHRQDYLAAHAALRYVLGRCLGIPPAQVHFASATPGAKPSLAPGPRSLDRRFNLSHTVGAVLIGVSETTPSTQQPAIEIGIDIERHRSLDELDSMARTVMSDAEYALWCELPLAPRQTAFYNLWTRKEAYLKAIGLGLYRSLQDVTVPLNADFLSSATPVIDSSGSAPNPNPVQWSVCDIPAPADYSASLCFPGLAMPQIILTEITPAAIQ